MFDLVADDDVTRHQALARHQALVAAAAAALRESAQPTAAFHRQHDQTILGRIDAFLTSTRDAEYPVLYLRWEAKYPDEWGAPASRICSAWTTKEVLLRRLDRDGVPEPIRQAVGDLIVAAIQRPYRCKDWRYARLVRHVADEPFVGRIERLLDAHDQLVRMRAGFIRHVAEQPQRRVSRGSWQRWLATDATAVVK